MKYKLIILLFFLNSCSQNMSSLEYKIPFNSKGLAYIYNENDFKDKLINKKFNNKFLEIGHNRLRPGTLIKLINPKTSDFIILKNKKMTKFPEFYKILITKPVARKLNLENNLPLVEVLEIKKNKSFIAEQTKIYKEEKKIHSNAPVELVKIDNISINKVIKVRKKKDNIFIIIGEFYSDKSALNLRKRITEELSSFNSKKLIIKIKSLNKIHLLSGPYTSINLMKNDYIQLKNFGFEELDITINE
jgi:hypothetical protein